MWAMAQRDLTYTAGQTGTQIVESYHNYLKNHGLNPKSIRGQRLDWLVNQLLAKILPSYEDKAIFKATGAKCSPSNCLPLYLINCPPLWLIAFPGFINNRREEDSVRRHINAATFIPDDHVRLVDGGFEVQSQTAPGTWYSISASNTFWSACDCKAGLRGNLCKHQVRCIACRA